MEFGSHGARYRTLRRVSTPPLDQLRRRLADGRATLGYLVSMPSVQVVQALARTGVDWLMIDTEHAPIGIESVAAMIAATAGTPVAPLVRVPGVRPELVKPALDCGALGIVFPQVATRAEAEAAVSAVRWRAAISPRTSAWPASSTTRACARSSRARRRRSSRRRRCRSAASRSRPTRRAR